MPVLWEDYEGNVIVDKSDIDIPIHILIALFECTNVTCPKCKSKNIKPIIFGLVERKDTGEHKNEFYPCDKFVGILVENNFIDNPGCVPDSYMKGEMEPHKICDNCRTCFDYREY